MGDNWPRAGAGSHCLCRQAPGRPASGRCRGDRTFYAAENRGESLRTSHAEGFTETELVKEIVGQSCYLVWRLVVKGSGEQGDEPADCGSFTGYIRMDVHPALLQLHPKIDGS